MPTKECPKCRHVTEFEVAAPLACPACGVVYSKVEALTQQGMNIRQVRVPTAAEREDARRREKEADERRAREPAERLARARTTGDWTGIDPAVFKREALSVMLATTEAIPGRAIEEARGVVAGDYAFAFGAIFEEVAGLGRNIVGSGYSFKTISALQEGRAAALAAVQFEALRHGANAVVGLRIDYEEFSGANQRGVLAVIATGTAVRIST